MHNMMENLKRKKYERLRYFVAIILVFNFLFSSFTATASFAISPDDYISGSITATYPYYAFVEDPDNPWGTVWDALDSTGTINYSDKYFDVSSPGDHPELRAVSYALALAGFENEADGYLSGSSISNSKLQLFLDQLGFSNFQKWDTESDGDGHSMGTTIARKTLPDGQTLIVVAPRNYNYMTEWLSNFNVGTSGDHAGFSESAGYIKDRLDEYIDTNNLVDYKIWMVGYSRGGAVIDLVAKMINENLSDYDMVADDFYVYTFGAPRASLTEPGYTNIHDVKDGNDLLLGYVFPELWGFHNTGTYEEIHPADLEIATSVINIAELADPATAANVLSDNEGLTRQVDTMNGREFMDDWMHFVTDNGLTREYFDTEIKKPLSAIMKLYQTRTLDKQSDFTGFISDTSKGLAGMVAGNAFYDLLLNYAGDLASLPAYLDLVKVLKGTATDSEVDELVIILTGYIGQYDDYETKLGQAPSISETEFEILKENLPKLVKAISPFLIADAIYTQNTFGENYSLYYTHTLIDNAENLVIGHIPESIMPILKSLIPEPETDDDENMPVPNTGDNEDIPVPDDDENMPVPNTGDNEDIQVPDTGMITNEGDDIVTTNNFVTIAVIFGIVTVIGVLMKKIIFFKYFKTCVSVLFLHKLIW